MKFSIGIRSLCTMGAAIIAAIATQSATANTCGGSPITATPDTWECLEECVDGTCVDITNTGMNGPYTFTGDATLDHSITGELDCTLSVDGNVEMDTAGNVVYIEVTDASSSGPGTCGNVEFSGFPWVALDPVFLTPGIIGSDGGDVHTPENGVAVGIIDDVTVSWTGLGFPIELCNDSIEVEFGNSLGNNPVSDPSYFAFSGTLSGGLGDCAVAGDLFPDSDFDVNAF